MPKSTPTHPKKEQSSIIPQIEKLLVEQTSVILQAVDEKLSAQDKRIEEGLAAQDKRIEEGLAAQDKRMEEKFIAQEIRILAAVDKRLAKTEERFAKSLDELTKTLDKFLKRLTDIEEEFTFMKEDLKRVKAVLREKLGVSCWAGRRAVSNLAGGCRRFHAQCCGGSRLEAQARRDQQLTPSASLKKEERNSCLSHISLLLS